MNSIEITDAFLNHYKLERKNGDSWEPMLPFIVMDIAYQIYNKEIRKIQCKHLLKKNKNIWINNYNLFNRKMFATLNQEQTETFVDVMDEFEQYISHHISVAQVQLINCMPDDVFEMQKVISSCMMIHSCTQIAKVVWERIYSNIDERLDNYHQYLVNMEISMYNFMQLYHTSGTTITISNSKEVEKAINTLCHKTIGWLKLK